MIKSRKTLKAAMKKYRSDLRINLLVKLKEQNMKPFEYGTFVKNYFDCVRERVRTIRENESQDLSECMCSAFLKEFLWYYDYMCKQVNMPKISSKKEDNISTDVSAGISKLSEVPDVNQVGLIQNKDIASLSSLQSQDDISDHNCSKNNTPENIYDQVEELKSPPSTNVTSIHLNQNEHETTSLLSQSLQPNETRNIEIGPRENICNGGDIPTVNNLNDYLTHVEFEFCDIMSQQTYYDQKFNARGFYDLARKELKWTIPAEHFGLSTYRRTYSEFLNVGLKLKRRN